MRKKWEYIGKREILRRVSALGYPVASGKLCSYAKFEGVEWLESPELKITVQRGGDWLQITRKRDAEDTEHQTHTHVRYNGRTYAERY